MIPSRPFLCVITDETSCPVTLAEKALKGGAAMIQLRHKTASGSQLFLWAMAICERCQPYHALCIINDRVDIALASKADGVHLGQHDMPARAARKLLGETGIIGVTASSLEEARQAEQDGANYIGFGHIYPTTSKLKETSPLGLDLLQKTANLISLPIIAIGGINIENAASVISFGAAGIAVIAAVSRANDPSRASHELVCAINNRTQ
jgi:thiamine-phosphate pyrophosphorylase